MKKSLISLFAACVMIFHIGDHYFNLDKFVYLKKQCAYFVSGTEFNLDSYHTQEICFNPKDLAEFKSLLDGIIFSQKENG